MNQDIFIGLNCQQHVAHFGPLMFDPISFCLSLRLPPRSHSCHAPAATMLLLLPRSCCPHAPAAPMLPLPPCSCCPRSRFSYTHSASTLTLPLPLSPRCFCCPTLPQPNTAAARRSRCPTLLPDTLSAQRCCCLTLHCIMLQCLMLPLHNAPTA